MKVWEGKFKVLSFYCDSDDRLALWAMARIIQEGAEGHTAQTGIGFSGLISQGKAWVLTRIHYEIHERPRCDQEITIATWSRGSDGLYALRDSVIKDAQGRVLMCSTAMWVVIDMNTRRVCRMHDLLADFSVCEDTATSVNKPTRLRMPAFTDSDRFMEFTVRNSMIDHTQHVNNAEYVKWISDMVCVDGIVDIKTLDIDYISESKRNETVNCFKIQDNCSCSIQISNSRGVAVNSVVGL